MHAPESAEPEFSRTLPVGSGAESRDFSFEADARECAALALRFGLLRLDRLSCSGRVEILSRGRRVLLGARVQAAYAQSCVVTLDPVEATMDEPLTRLYSRDLGRSKPSREVVIIVTTPEAGDEDEIEPLSGDLLDVGEIAAEHFGVMLDPYPRSPTASRAPDAMKS